MADIPAKRIHNPVTGKDYEIRHYSSKFDNSGQIKPLWSSKKKTLNCKSRQSQREE